MNRNMNRLVCVDLELTRPYRMYVVVPPEATDDEEHDIAKAALIQMDADEFKQKVIDASADRDPFIQIEDIELLDVDEDYSEPTDLPVGTVTK